jgi:hypothetical protein
MLKDVITEAELRALLGEAEAADTAGPSSPAWDGDERKLLHALVRNQLRLLHTIEEMQSELRLLKAAAGQTGRGARESAAGLEPLPLPFIKQGAAAQAEASEPYDDEDRSGGAEHSRKERYKRKSFW